MSHDASQIWVGCVACRDAGFRVGAWFDEGDEPHTMDEFHDHRTVKGGTWVPQVWFPYQHYSDGGKPHEELFRSEGE